MASLELRPNARCRRCLSKPTRALESTSAVRLRIKRCKEKSCGKIFSSAVITAVATDASGDKERGGRDYESNDEIKAALYKAVQGINRGIFGVTSAKKFEIWELVELLESRNLTPQPTDYLLDKVDGCWKLVYSTISILGAKGTKLGLHDFITLGDFFQIIDVTKEKTINVIEFNVRGFKMLNGQLTIEASFKISSKIARTF